MCWLSENPVNVALTCSGMNHLTNLDPEQTLLLFHHQHVCKKRLHSFAQGVKITNMAL
jgi:hypothetical protein